MKFLLVEVSRCEYSSVILEVPDDFPTGWPNHELVRRAACATIGHSEWEKDWDGASVEATSVAQIAEDVAKQYSVYRIDSDGQEFAG